MAGRFFTALPESRQNALYGATGFWKKHTKMYLEPHNNKEQIVEWSALTLWFYQAT